ncbi:MAG: hypothetical protein R3F42_04375 [Pseudomonadota bacterium]
MAGISKGSASCWYGYLMAGERSSPVLRDEGFETGNRKTVYLYNLKRGEIVEYDLATVAAKLRDLKPSEAGFIGELDAGYKKARRAFKGRGGRDRSVVEAAIIPLAKPADTDYSDDEALDEDDADLWPESSEA